MSTRKLMELVNTYADAKTEGSAWKIRAAETDLLSFYEHRDLGLKLREWRQDLEDACNNLNGISLEDFVEDVGSKALGRFDSALAEITDNIDSVHESIDDCIP